MMKKNILKLDVLLICAAALFASCSGIPDSRGELENPGMFTLTGIPEEFDGKLVYVSIDFRDAAPPLAAREPNYSPFQRKPQNNAAPPLVAREPPGGRQSGSDLELIVYDGELKLPLYTQGFFSLGGYSGSDTYNIWFTISARDAMDKWKLSYYATITFKSVQFENGVAAVNWNDGEVNWVMKAGN
jgi:hypothetical protein